MTHSLGTCLSRRQFIAISGGALAAAILPESSVASPSVPLRVGLIGGDSDGISLLARALRAESDFRLVAIADELEARARRALDIFTHQRRRGGAPPQIDIPPSGVLTGPGAAERLCSMSGLDVVFVAGIPALRPRHVAAAIAGGKHVFMLGPGAVDAEGCRALLKAADYAETKGLSIGVDIHAGDETLAGPTSIDVRWQRAPWRRFVPGGSAVQNWYFDQALSGGPLLTENFSLIDQVNQLKRSLPVVALGTVNDRSGEHAIDYRYADESMFRLRFRLGYGLATEIETHLADGSPLPAKRGGATDAAGTFLRAITFGRQGGWRPRLDRLVATTRTALLGREAARLGRPMEWGEIV